MMPSSTPAANKINATVRIPIRIKSTGMTFSNIKEFFGICDFLLTGESSGMFTSLSQVWTLYIFQQMFKRVNASFGRFILIFE